MTVAPLQKSINDDDFDDLLSAKLKPTTRNAIINQAKQQKIDTTKIQFIDYTAIKELTDDNEPIEISLNQVASLFASTIDEYHLNQIKQIIIDIEIENAKGDEKEQARLHIVRNKILTQKNSKQKTYQSGIDTKAFVSQPQHREAIFKPVDIIMPTPSSKYYRNEIYTDLIINEHPSSSFQYFELLGMNATEKLADCQYQFHPDGLTEAVIIKRKAESTQTLFKGKKNLTLTEDWQALPSLDPNETLLDIEINGLKRKDFEIKFSNENHLYYIRLTEPLKESKAVPITLLLRMPKHYQTNLIFNTLSPNPDHQDIHHLLLKYLKFGKDDGKLRNSIGIAVHNGYEYLNEARKLTVASCRLRAICFKERNAASTPPDIPVSIVVNRDHCFIEMELDHLRQSYCLGGYRDTLSLVKTVKENTLLSFWLSIKYTSFFY